MSKIFKMKLLTLSRKYADTPAGRRDWISLQLRNDAKRLAAIEYLGEKWVLAKRVERA